MNTSHPAFNQSAYLSVGDKIVVTKFGGVRHVGIFVFNGVLHNSPGKGEHLSTLDEFTKGQVPVIEKTNATPWLVEQRANEILRNPRPYDLMNRNCEHTAHDLLTSRPESPQLVAGLLALGVALIGALIIVPNAQKA